MAVGSRDHHPDRRRIQEHDDAQLEQADVIAGDAQCACRGLCGDSVHAEPLSTARRDSLAVGSVRGIMTRANVSTADHTSVAIATCRPLKRAASVRAAAAPIATCSAKTTSVMIALRPTGDRIPHRRIAAAAVYTMRTPITSTAPRCSIVNALTPEKSGVSPPPHRGQAWQPASDFLPTTVDPVNSNK